MKSNRSRKVRAWLLGGITFLGVVAAAGCAGSRCMTDCTSPKSRLIPAKTAAPEPAFVTAVALAETEAAPTVNIYGEFDGIERAPVKNTSEAGFEQHTFVDEGYDGDVAISPDAQWIAFSSTRHNEKSDIYLQRVGGLSVMQLTSDSSDDAFPVFSPDGTRVAFCSTRGGTWDIYVMDIDGKNVTQITSGPSQDLHPSFSPDGNRLAYCTMGSRSGQWELWTVDLNTNQKGMIGFGLFPCWSPDKSKDRIAYQKARARGSRWFSLWTLDLVDGEARHSMEVAVSTNAAIVSPAWSPDGTKLAFSTIVDPARSIGTRRAGQQDVWTINADGTNRHRMTDGNGTNATPFWASDNRIYFVSDRGGTECIWSARADAISNFSTASKPKDAKKEAVGATDPKELAN